jgi:DNA-binding transcriptional ArsR family regulator
MPAVLPPVWLLRTRALAHPARRALLHALSRHECDVGTLSHGTGMDQPAVSKHLAALRSARLVQVRVEGRRRCYSLAHEDIVVSLLHLLDQLQSQYQARPPRTSG